MSNPTLRKNRTVVSAGMPYASGCVGSMWTRKLEPVRRTPCPTDPRARFLTGMPNRSIASAVALSRSTSDPPLRTNSFRASTPARPRVLLYSAGYSGRQRGARRGLSLACPRSPGACHPRTPMASNFAFEPALLNLIGIDPAVRKFPLVEEKACPSFVDVATREPPVEPHSQRLQLRHRARGRRRGGGEGQAELGGERLHGGAWWSTHSQGSRRCREPTAADGFGSR